MADNQLTPEKVPTWEEIARDHGRFLFTVAFRLTGNYDDTQDLVQEVLLRVERGLVNYQPGNLNGWLSRITTNAFLDAVRRKKRRPEQALPDEPDRVLAGAPGADTALAEAKLPDHLQAALLGLPEDYRAVVVMCDVVGLQYDEISSQLGIPVGTVRSRIHRGRSRLRETLGPILDEEQG